jgi:hypothetical protein
MKDWLKKAWHDPVWSKVIAALIVGVGGLVCTWLWSLRSLIGSGTLGWIGVKAAILAYVSWASGASGISRALLILIVCVGVLGWMYAANAWLRLSMLRDAVMRQTRERGTRDAEVSARTKVPPPPAVAALRVKLAVPAASLSHTQRLMFHILCLQYPGAIDLNSLGGMLGLTYPAAEKLFEEAVETGLIEMNNVLNHRSNRMQALVGLTKDCCASIKMASATIRMANF